MLRATLFSPDGTITYSTDHRLIGTKAGSAEHLREAQSGTVRGDVTTLAPTGLDSKQEKVLRTYAPVSARDGTGVVAVFQDYGPIARAAEATFLPVAGIFEGVLLLFVVALVPILRRVRVRLRRQMYEIEYRASYDALTGLPNRALFRDRLADALTARGADDAPLAVIVLDVDHFREVNDTLGHASGDHLLRQLSVRLGGALDAGASLARLDGDEFGIFLPAATADDALRFADLLHDELERPFELHGLPLEVAASAGVAVYPDHGTDAETLLQRADVAMYMAKDSHEPTAIYDAEQDQSDAARLALAGELRRAIQGEELAVHFQAKAALDTGRIVGAEALVRWEHVERGFIPPSDFIPVAERTGLIKPLSRYVLASTIRQCGRWNAAGLDLHVSVNLTIPDLLDLDLPGYIAVLLDETSVRSEQLELEITETTILADPFRVRQVLASLNQMGLRLAIDDFGTGYSSLAYLRRLPVQTIKIDRSFVMGMCEDANDATIVRSTIDLGRNLGLDVVAEGVETRQAWDALAAQGCTLAQGYFIGRPMPAAELTAMLARETAAAEQGVAAAASG